MYCKNIEDNTTVPSVYWIINDREAGLFNTSKHQGGYLTIADGTSQGVDCRT